MDASAQLESDGRGRLRAGSGALAWLSSQLAGEADRLVLWLPVFFGGGAALYFSLAREPETVLVFGLVSVASALRLVVRRGELALALTAAFLASTLGFAAAKLKTELVRAPVLTKDLRKAKLTGWLERIEDRAGRGQRFLIRVRQIDGLAEAQTPYRVRISLRGQKVSFGPGTFVSIQANLSPPAAPALAGGYDFARRAWYQRLGAVGYGFAPPRPAAPIVATPWRIRLDAWVALQRTRLATRIRDHISGPSGAIAAALITGERSAIPERQLKQLRDAGLAHILAISGLHMAIMAGSFYWLIRALLALHPSLAVRHEIKKWAVACAMLGAVIFLLLSGASIATQRAFVMIFLVFLAILTDRPAISLRNVAIAALAVMLLWPEDVLNVSFQMSFAAATALVAVFEWLRERQVARAIRFGTTPGLGRIAISYVAGVATTTAIASIAVAPIAAYHFHKITQFSLLSNLLAVPVVAMLVMPMALLSLLGLPFGLDVLSLQLMGAGINWVSQVAAEVSSWKGAVRPVAAFPAYAVVAMALGALWFFIWRRRWRYLGLAIAAIGVIATTLGRVPDLIVGRDGRAVALRGTDGRLAALSSVAGRYEMRLWLEADGDRAGVKEAAKRRAFSCDGEGCVAKSKGHIIAVSRALSAYDRDCRSASILVLQFRQRIPCPNARLVIDREKLRAKGTHEIWLGEKNIRVRTVGDWRGHRPWTRN